MLEDYYADHVAAGGEVLGTDRRLAGEIEGQALVAVADLVLAPRAQVKSRSCALSPSRSPLGPAELAKDVSAQLLWLLAYGQPTEPPVSPPRLLLCAAQAHGHRGDAQRRGSRLRAP